MKTGIQILVVDDDRRMTQTLVDILNTKGFSVEAANSGDEALERLQAQSFDCLLTDIKMPGITGVELSRRAREIQPGLPVILMTAYAAKEQTDLALEEGAIDVVDKPIDLNHLLGFFAAMHDECLITIVDDDPDFCQSLQDILERRSFEVQAICDPHQVLAEFPSETQIVLLDMKLSSLNGLDILKEIRKKNPHIPVILVTGFRDEMAQAIGVALDLKAFTCLYKPFQIDELLLTITRIRFHQFQPT